MSCDRTTCFRGRSRKVQNLEIMAWKTFIPVSWINPGLTRSNVTSGPSDVCSSWTRQVADVLAITLWRVCGKTTVRAALWMVATRTSFLSCSSLKCSTVTKVLSEFTSSEMKCRCTTFLSLRRFHPIYLSINETPTRMSTANFTVTPTHSQIFKSPMGMNNKMEPSSTNASFVKVSRSEKWLLLIVSKLFFLYLCFPYSVASCIDVGESGVWL